MLYFTLVQLIFASFPFIPRRLALKVKKIVSFFSAFGGYRELSAEQLTEELKTELPKDQKGLQKSEVLEAFT